MHKIRVAMLVLVMLVALMTAAGCVKDGGSSNDGSSTPVPTPVPTVASKCYSDEIENSYGMCVKRYAPAQPTAVHVNTQPTPNANPKGEQGIVCVLSGQANAACITK